MVQSVQDFGSNGDTAILHIVINIQVDEKNTN